MWNKVLALMLGIFLLGGCASTHKSLTYREQLDIYKDMKIRLYQVAAPIKAAGVGLCDKTDNVQTTVTHRLSDYPEDLRPVAESYWGLGDEDTEIARLNHGNTSVVCYAPLALGYANPPGAWTNGESIFVTPSLLAEVDDLGLALIVAHELGHIVLNHVARAQSEKLEQEADRFALFLLARAGLDYKEAAKQNAASRRPHSKITNLYTKNNDRAAQFSNIVLEIEKLQAEGKALLP